MTVGLDDPFPAFGKLTQKVKGEMALVFCFQGPGTCRSVWFKKWGSPNGSWGIVSLHSALESDERSGFAGFVWFTAVYIITHQSEIPS